MAQRRSFEALRVPAFRRYWTAQVISLTGTWTHYAAQGWLVYSLSHSPFYLGLNGTALALPMLLFSYLGGHLADRLSKASLLRLFYTIASIPPLVLFFLTITGLVTVWHCIVIGFLMGSINALEFPTRQTFLHEIVGSERILNAVAMSSAAFNSSRMLGPLIAGLLIPKLGVSICFLINTISFVPLVFVLGTISTEKTYQKTQKTSFKAGVVEVVRFIAARKEVLVVIATVFVFSLLGLPYHHFLPVFADRVFGRGPEGLGMLMSAGGFGALSAAVFLSFIGEPQNKRRYMAFSSAGFPLALFLFALNKNFFFHFFSSGWQDFLW
ncbi:MAG: MFS transporter [Nitrospirae bacterium]|nr:MAG: MFS transporter [Nitrospirota bacterium]